MDVLENKAGRVVVRSSQVNKKNWRVNTFHTRESFGALDQNKLANTSLTNVPMKVKSGTQAFSNISYHITCTFFITFHNKM